MSEPFFLKKTVLVFRLTMVVAKKMPEGEESYMKDALSILPPLLASRVFVAILSNLSN